MESRCPLRKDIGELQATVLPTGDGPSNVTRPSDGFFQGVGGSDLSFLEM